LVLEFSEEFAQNCDFLMEKAASEMPFALVYGNRETLHHENWTLHQ
jgi:hypothetical protein